MDFSHAKFHLVTKLRRQGIITTDRVYDAMMDVPRHAFVPAEVANRAYEDRPLHIGQNQTISAPHMNAMMCEVLQIQPGDNILEVGTGSGYHAALLSYLTGPKGKIVTIERFPELAQHARAVFQELQITNIEVIVGDGTCGAPKSAPYDKILVTAAGPAPPPPLLAQLSSHHGIMCIPLGKKHSLQALYRIDKEGDRTQSQRITGVMFVPLIGEHGFRD